MADRYTYNDPNSIERAAIVDFLKRAQKRVEEHPEILVFKPEQGNLVINWLFALLGRKPSEMGEGK